MLKVVRYRPAQATVIALLSALVTACALLIPLEQRAIDQASARVELGRASAAAQVLQLESSGYLSSFYTGGGQPARALTPAELYDEVPAAVRRSFGRPVGAQLIGVTMPASDAGSAAGVLAWREGACAHLRLASGRCPAAAREILVSTADVRSFGWDVGTVLGALESQPNDARQSPRRMSLTVTGTYRASHDPWWDTWTLTGLSGTKPERNAAVQHDTWLTDPATFVEQPTWRNPSSRIDLRLRHSVTGVDDLLSLGRRIDDLTHAQTRRPALVAVVNVHSDLPDVAASVRKAQDQARVTIPALMAPLGVLGLVVLWMALGTAVEQRRPEVALARLRGRGARGAQAHLVRELVTVVLLGVPVGVLVALGVSWPARHLLLPKGVPLEVRVPVLSALLVAVAVLVGAVLLATTAVSREPIVALMRRIPPRRRTRGIGTVDAVIVTVALLILFSFVTGRLTGPVALVAPAVLAFASGLVLARLMAPIAAGLGRSLLARGRTSSGIGLLQLARRPGIRATTALLTVAVAILVFAGDAVAVGARNRATAAAQQVGAPAVMTVTGGDAVDVRRALSDADVSARAATPVVLQRGVTRGDQNVLYVDAAHFAAVGAFADTTAAAADLRRLSPPAVEPVRIAGRALSVVVSTDELYRGSDHPVSLEAVLLRADGTTSTAPLGAIPTGTTTGQRMSAPVDCEAGCVLTGWKISTSPANAGTGRLVIGNVRTESGAVALGGARTWRGIPSGESKLVAIAADAGSLTVFVDNGGASELVLQHRWVPERLPAIVAGTLPAGSDHQQFTSRGLDGADRDMQVAGRLPWMPATGPNTAVTDLRLAERSGSALGEDAELQVWFADTAALGRVRSALLDHGLQVGDVVRTSEVRRDLDRTAATWSLELGVLVGGACLLVALLGLAIAAAGAWRSRAHDLAVLRLNGLPLRDVRRISVIEQLPSLLAAVVLGAVGGVVAAHFALPTLPLLATDPQVDLVDLSAAWGVVLTLGAAAVVLLGLVGWAGARAVAAAAGPTRVTEAP